MKRKEPTRFSYIFLRIHVRTPRILNLLDIRRRLIVAMANLEELKDSTFVNLITSVEKIERAGVPKKRGVRREKQAEVEGAEELKDDVVSMITSALSQMDNPDPVPGLSAAQIQALRALYTVINNKSRTDEDLEIALEAAVMQLNPDYTPKMQEVEEEVEEEIDRDRETATGMSD